MTTQPPRTPEQDDDDWCALLIGQAAPDAQPHTRQEAEILRQAVLERHRQPVAPLCDADFARGRERLLFELRRETPPIRPWWKHPVLLAGLAAGLAGVVLLPLLHHGLDLQPPSTPESITKEPTGEGAPKIKQFRLPTMLYTDQPAAAAAELAQSLNRLGIAAQPIQQDGSWLIDAPLPKTPPPGWAEVLARHGLRPPADQRLLVEFAPKPAVSNR